MFVLCAKLNRLPLLSHFRGKRPATQFVNGNQVSVTFGRIGTAGQTQTKQSADLAAATKHANKLIEQKLAKGYVEQRVAA